MWDSNSKKINEEWMHVIKIQAVNEYTYMKVKKVDSWHKVVIQDLFISYHSEIIKKAQ